MARVRFDAVIRPNLVDALESDVRVVSGTWFRHGAHDSVERFVWSLSLVYFRFDAHDRYASSTCYEIDTLFRVFVLKELHGWHHEPALVKYLNQHPELRDQLGFKPIPDQSTLWRSWNKRFTADLSETVETAARTILIKVRNAGVRVPREPERKLRHHDGDTEESKPDDNAVLERARKITDHASRVIFPAFSLDREEGCEIHENVYWSLQTYLGLRENLAANEGAHSFFHESTRDSSSDVR